jgi:predicted phage-related endonuclease
VQENVLNRGHEIEALARPFAVEFAGVDGFYPATVSVGRLSASSDGLDMPDETAWECKSLNQDNRPIVLAGKVPEEHMPQCQQVLMVTGADRLLFTVSDGTRENTHHVWVEPDTDWFDRIRAAWKQFHEDLASYQHVEVLPAAVATEQPSLPAVVVTMGGALTVSSNLPDFAVALREYIKTIPAKPSTDQEFADAELACKNLKKAEDALQLAENNALAGMTDVEAMRRVVADLRALARATRLQAEKNVEARKIAVRDEIKQEFSRQAADHLDGLNAAIGKPYMPAVPVDFAGAMKGKKTITGLRDACSQALANFKIAASAVAAGIQTNMRYEQEHAAGFEFLFADFKTIVLKASDDFQAVITSRVATHKAEEARKAREAAEAEETLIASTWANARRIEGDSVAYIQKAITYFESGPGTFANDPRPRVAAAVAEARAEMAEKLKTAQERESAQVAAAPAPTPAVLAEVAAAVAAVPYAKPVFARPAAAPAPVGAQPTLRMGAICERLGFIINVAFLEQIGVTPADHDVRKMPLFHDHQFAEICQALIQHIESVAELAPA